MKNTIIAIVGSLIASHALANPFTGAYVTGALGGISSDFQMRGKGNLNLGNDTDILLTPNNSNSYDNSVLGTFGLGYAYPYTYACNDFIVGIQGDANFFNTNRNQVATFSEFGNAFFLKSTIKAQLKNSYDLLFRPGWLMDPSTLLYGLIGASFGDFQIAQSARIKENLGFFTIDRSTSSSHSSWQTGFTVGLGVQQALWKNASAALEYSYTDYGNLSASSSSAPLFIEDIRVGTVNGSVNKVRAFTNSVSLRFFYTFA